MRTSTGRDWGLTLLRLAVGTVFLMHGQQKLFVFGIGGVAGGFTKMGLPMPDVLATVVSLAEFLGGACLVLGLFTRWAALLLAAVMSVATFHVHLPNGFFLPRGFEFTFVLLLANLTLALSGPGAASLSSVLPARFQSAKGSASDAGPALSGTTPCTGK